MFLYGHMLNVNDEFDYRMPDGSTQHVVILDKWPSLIFKGFYWIELWAEGPNTLRRPVALRAVGAHDPFHDVTRPPRELATGTATPYHGSNSAH